MTHLDLRPAIDRIAELVAGTDDADLDRPTPCPGYPVGGLIAHIGGFALAFAAGARKEVPPLGTPTGDEGLPDDWRTVVPERLRALADAWDDPAAWAGETVVAGAELTGEAAGLFALDEALIHGWDLAVATDRPWAPPPEAVEALLRFVTSLRDAGPTPEFLFGPVVDVPGDAPATERLLALTGRDPCWPPVGDEVVPPT